MRDTVTTLAFVACALCIAAMIALALFHAASVPFHAGDDLVWLRHISGGLAKVWTQPSPFRHFRPTFGTWLIALQAFGLTGPVGLALSSLATSILVAVLAYWASRAVLDPLPALLGATILLIHPVRQQHLFWASGQIDALCLALSFLCVGLALRSYERDSIAVSSLVLIGFGTAFAVLSKEVALGLPLWIAALPGASSWRRRLALGAASAAGATAAALLGLAVLAGPGRSGSLFSRSGSLASLAYPSRLVWPGDLGLWLVEAKLRGSYTSFFLVGAMTAAAGSWLIWSCRKRYRDPWVHAGLVLLAAGALTWAIRQEDRAIGLGCAGAGWIVAGAVTFRVRRRAGFRAALLPAAVPIGLAVVWSPLWITWEQRWLDAARTSRDVYDSARQWRSEAGAESLLVAVGSVTSIGPGAKALAISEIDSCSFDSLVVEGTRPVPPLNYEPLGPGRVRLSTSGNASLVWWCRPDPGVGIVEVTCDAAGLPREAVFDTGLLDGLVAVRQCGPADVRRWDGHSFSPLPGSQRIPESSNLR